jgi:hypothetical protein
MLKGLLNGVSEGWLWIT